MQFTVAPSPEATTTDSATLTEDVLSNIGLHVVHQNGDTDETLAGVRIDVNDAAGPDFTLYLGDDPGTAKTLAQAFADGDITQATDGGVDYYVLSPEQAGQLSARGGANLDGDLHGFDFQYQVTDDHHGSAASGGSTTSGWKNAHFDLDANPVTDAPAVSITDIAGTKGTTTSADDVTGDDANPDTATLTAADTVTVTLNVESPDTDGSEHLVRVVIDGVPDGVTVTGGELIGGGQWLLVYDGADAKPINGAGGLQLPVEFVVSDQAGSIAGKDITLTVQVQDRGDQPGQATTVESDSVTWHLDTSFGPGAGDIPATIEQWEYNDAHAAEDTSFALSDIIDARVDVGSTAANIFTITLEDLPPGTEVEGMTHTTIVEGGVPHDVWSASAVSTSGMTAEQIEQMLQDLMDGITIKPPLDSNDNNAAGAFNFDAKLTTSIAGGSHNETADIDSGDLVVPVDPVTDPATIGIQLDTSVETGELNESDTSVPITLTVGDAADGAAGSIVDGKLYLQVSADTAGLQDGTLTVDGTAYTLQSVTGVNGVPDGDYYVVDNVAMGDTLHLVYTPAGAMSAGNVTVDAWVQNVEAGSAEAADNSPLTSTGSGTLEVHISNDGAAIDSQAATGGEAAGKSSDAPIALDLSAALNDSDGSEHFVSILLSNLPDGFLVYTGADAASATLASNAGGADGFNTWVISGADGTLPGYVGIMPPPHWSGTLSDLQVIVESGENTLSETRIDTHDLADVTVDPVADGLELTTTKSFGQENAVIALNLNASMHDARDATVKDASDHVIAQDGSTETTTLKITGLGEHASFYVGDAHTQLDAGHFSYDSSTQTYTLTGLSQDDLNTLAFMQAKSALADQDGAASGMQIGVEAWTVESGDPTHESAHVDSTITLNISDQLATTGDNSLLWTGNAIDGRSGADTVHLRQGEDLSGADLAGKLSHIETIDLSIGGANQVDGLTPEQVKAILGSGTGAGSELTVKGDTEDALTLDGNWADNGDGTWTGTIDDGGATSTVTLNVDGDMSVAGPAGAFGMEGMSFSPMALSLDFDNAQPEGGADESAFLFDHDGALPSFESVLAPPSTPSPDGDAGGTDGWLPGQDSDSGALPQPGADVPAGDGSMAYTAFVPDPSLPDDDLQHSLASAHAAG